MSKFQNLLKDQRWILAILIGLILFIGLLLLLGAGLFVFYSFRTSTVQEGNPSINGGSLEAVYLSTKPKINGRIEDGEWGESSSYLFATHPAPNENSTATVRFAWDEDFLYAVFDIADTQVEGSSEIWNGDSVSISFQNGSSIEEYRHSLTGEEKTLIPDRNGFGLQSNHALKGSTTFNTVTDIDEGFVIEMKIPWAEPPIAGDTIEFDILSVDHDNFPNTTHDDPKAAFSKISLDLDQDIMTIGGELTLLNQE